MRFANGTALLDQFAAFDHFRSLPPLVHTLLPTKFQLTLLPPSRDVPSLAWIVASVAEESRTAAKEIEETPTDRAHELPALIKDANQNHQRSPSPLF